MRYIDALWRILKEIDDVDDFDFYFTCSLLSYALQNQGLTEKQVNCAKRLFKKYQHLFPEVPEEKYELRVIQGGKK